MARRAAVRVLETLIAAKKGGYFTNAWYSYLRRDDVEELALATLNATERAVYRRALEKAGE